MERPIPYRKLTSRRDAAAIGSVRDGHLSEMKHLIDDVPVVRMLRSRQRAVNFVTASVMAEVNAPRDVLSADGEGSVEEIASLLTSLQLSPSDLVNPGDGWCTIEQFPPLSDEVLVWRNKTRARALGMWLLAATLIGAILFASWKLIVIGSG